MRPSRYTLVAIILHWVMALSVLDTQTVLYVVVPWPPLPILSTLDNKKPVEDALKLVHTYGAWALIVLVAVHAGAALHHHFIAKDDVLRRILPSGRNTS